LSCGFLVRRILPISFFPCQRGVNLHCRSLQVIALDKYFMDFDAAGVPVHDPRHPPASSWPVTSSSSFLALGVLDEHLILNDIRAVLQRLALLPRLKGSSGPHQYVYLQSPPPQRFPPSQMALPSAGTERSRALLRPCFQIPCSTANLSLLWFLVHRFSIFSAITARQKECWTELLPASRCRPLPLFSRVVSFSL